MSKADGYISKSNNFTGLVAKVREILTSGT